MSHCTLSLSYEEQPFESLGAADRALVCAAQQAARGAYAPYSRFRVGAALQLADGTVLTGSNQENAAYPSGTCAERCVVFYAGAQHPDVPAASLAIAAIDATGAYTAAPITPCGACRQVLIETERRGGQPLRIVLYGAQRCLIIPSAQVLLPFQFDSSALEG